MKKKKLVALATAICLAVPCYAGGGFEPQGLLYLNVPFGGNTSRIQLASFGFMLQQRSDDSQIQSMSLRQAPLVDFRFTAKGDQDIRVLGLETYRFRANEEQNTSPKPSAEINWWIVGGFAVGAIAFIAHEERKSKQSSHSCPPGWVDHGTFCARF